MQEYIYLIKLIVQKNAYFEGVTDVTENGHRLISSKEFQYCLWLSYVFFQVVIGYVSVIVHCILNEGVFYYALAVLPVLCYGISFGFHSKAYHCRKFEVSRTPGSGQTMQYDKQTNQHCLLLV